MLITPEYQKQQQEFHEQRPDYGCNAARHAEFVMATAAKLHTKSILDYGCGKATLQKAIPYPIQNYDPCMPEYAKRPTPADIVTCLDVLEHIEPNCLEYVLQDLQSLTKQIVFLNVATRPAKKVLQDGRNAHLIQKPSNWWLARLLPYFDIVSLQAGQGEFACIAAPPGIVVTPAEPEMTSYIPGST